MSIQNDNYGVIILTIFLTLIIGIIAAIVGALVGGGGLISVPALMLFGISPQAAIATNRLGSFGLSFGAIAKYWKEKKINWKMALVLTLISLPGTYFGTKILISIDKDLLAKIAGIAIIVLVPLIFIKKPIDDLQKEIPRSHTFVGSILYFFVSIYGGFFGAGTGILARYVLMLLFKMKAVNSNATDIVVGCLSSILGLAMLLNTGFINWKLGIILFLGMLIGGWMGAHIAVKKGDEWVKIAFVVITLVMGVKLIFF